jgi:hypothetical protein
MIDDQVDRHRRVEPPRIAAEPDHRVAHRREVAEERHARGVGHQHAGEAECDLAPGAAAVQPPRHRGDVGAVGAALGVLAQHVLEHHLERARQPRHAGEAERLGRGEAVVLEHRAADAKLASRRTTRDAHPVSSSDVAMRDLAIAARLQPALRIAGAVASGRSFSRISAVVPTSAYLAAMSKRFTACEVWLRS